MPGQQAESVMAHRGTRSEKDHRHTLEWDRITTDIQGVTGRHFGVSFERECSIAYRKGTPGEPEETCTISVRDACSLKTKATL